MDQTFKLPASPLFGGPDVIGGNIDEPDTAQPSIGRDEGEAGDRGGSFDIGGEFPVEPREDGSDEPGPDNEGTA